MANEPLQVSAEPHSRPPGLWSKLQRGLAMTHGEILGRMGAALEGRAFLDETTLERLEESLIAADLGVETALELVERLRLGASRGAVSPQRLRDALVEEMADLLGAASAAPLTATESGPCVTLVVGVNGSGKTTSIAKLARRQQAAGRSVLLAAADTFRAAASEQLALWGERLAVDVVRQRSEAVGADPAAVVFDALQAARARRIDEVFVDTAGRLHTQGHLMAELAKIRRVIEREAPERRHRTLLVLDATTGQNALAQAREFASAAAVDGILLTKLDGTAKGGMAVAVARSLRLPVLYLGVGEGADDLVDFRPREFAAALLG